MKKTALLLPALLAGLSLGPALVEPLNYNLLKFSETASRTVPNNWMTVRLKVSTTHANPAQAAASPAQKWSWKAATPTKATATAPALGKTSPSCAFPAAISKPSAS